jgi:hypothetical protein
MCPVMRANSRPSFALGCGGDDLKSAMSPLMKADRERLAKLLGMLGSDHAGERGNAALAIERLRRERGLSWDEVLPADGVRHDPARD